MLQSSLAGLRILVVEDEPLVALLLEDILLDLGCILVGPARLIEMALGLVDTEEIDGAVLDVNIGDQPVYPVADALVARGIPIIFSSGYGKTDLPERFRQLPILPKPFDFRRVETCLTENFLQRG